LNIKKPLRSKKQLKPSSSKLGGAVIGSKQYKVEQKARKAKAKIKAPHLQPPSKGPD